jgi:hypothetical protein
MSVSCIPDSVKLRLWGKAAGRCQYDGCNKPLWRDDLTKAEFNTAYIAHVVADSVDGPRGHATRSKLLASDISNLMLMCDEHHRLIDKGDVAGHPEDRLLAMKAQHEQRIETLGEITGNKQSHVVLYGANIGAQGSPLSLREAAIGMVPARYPASQQPISLGLGNSSFEDRTPEFWQFEGMQVRNMVAQQIRPRIKSGEVTHLSVFALAPQPLLMLLGSELSDIPFAEACQRRKEPQSWKWEEEPLSFDLTVIAPTKPKKGDAALVFALSATVTDERVTSVLGDDIPIWRVTIPKPDNDFVRSRAQTEAFRKTMRPLLDQIKAAHGEKATIHVFPAMPVSLAVDFGRVLNAKSDLPLIVYDENKKLGGFVKALGINAATRPEPRN